MVLRLKQVDFKARLHDLKHPLAFSVLSVSRPVLPLEQMSSPDDVILSQLQAISQLFSPYPPSGRFCQVSELTIHEENGRPSGEIFVWSKLGQNPSEMDVRTNARIKNAICDQLLATKAEIIQSQAVFSFCVQHGR